MKERIKFKCWADKIFEFIRQGVRKIGIGTLFNLLAFILFIFSLLFSAILIQQQAIFKILSQIFLGGFIGGFTNFVAIKMLFKKYWYLPGSGVLLKNREKIQNSLAETVETHLINVDLLKEKLRNEIKKVNPSSLKDSLNKVIEEFREDVIEYINREETFLKVVETLKKYEGFLGKIIDITGIKTYHTLAHDILNFITEKVRNFAIDEAMINEVLKKTGDMEEFFFKPNNPFVIKHYNRNDSIAYILFEKINIKQIVIDKLSKYPAEKVRDIIEENIKEHLGWLEVFGVILGIVFTFILFIIHQILL